MKNKIIFQTLILLTFFLFSCQSNDPQHIEQEKIHDELMVVHDEVMPKMGHINKLRRTLVKHLKNNEAVPAETKNLVEENIKFLENADEGMMDWMAEYKKPSKLRDDKTHEEILAYLESERPKVEKVKADILNSIAQAEELIKTLGIN